MGGLAASGLTGRLGSVETASEGDGDGGGSATLPDGRIGVGGAGNVLSSDPKLRYRSGSIENDGDGTPLGSLAWLKLSLTNVAATCEGAISFIRDAAQQAYIRYRQAGSLVAPTAQTIEARFTDATSLLSLFRVGDDANADGSNPLVVDAKNLDTYIGSDIELPAAATKGFGWLPTIDGDPVGTPDADGAPGTEQAPVAVGTDAFWTYRNGVWIQAGRPIALPGGEFSGSAAQYAITGIDGDTMGGITIGGTITTRTVSGGSGQDVYWTFLPNGSGSACSAWNGGNTGATGANRGLTFYRQAAGAQTVFGFSLTMLSTKANRYLNRTYEARVWDMNNLLSGFTWGYWVGATVATNLTSLILTATYIDGTAVSYTPIDTNSFVQWQALGRP